MAHDPGLERRLADVLAGLGVEAAPKRMFGGVAFMVNGNMCVGITNKSNLMVRFDPVRHAEIAEWDGALPMTYGKGGMNGFLFLDPIALANRRGLEKWVRLALAYVLALPPKSAKGGSNRKRAPSKPPARSNGKRPKK